MNLLISLRRKTAMPSLGVISAAMALVVAAASVHAKTGDRNQPMNVTQDSVSGFYAPNTITTLIGHVIVTQGTMKATGDNAKITLDAGEQVSRIFMVGKPAHIEQMDDNNNLMTGEAPTLDYDNINGIAVLTPNAVITEKGTGESHADKITYDTNTKRVIGVGHVSAIYYPKPKSPKDTPTPSETAKPAGAVSAPTTPVAEK